MNDEHPKIDGRTKRALDMAIARKQVSQKSYHGVLEGALTLREAKAIGRDGGPATADASVGRSSRGAATETAREGQEQPTNATQDSPPQPVSRISKDDATQDCWCGCQQLTSPGRMWRPGHDQRAKGIIKRAVREGKAEKLSDRLKEYGTVRGLV